MVTRMRDQLCSACSKIDVVGLFSGYRHPETHYSELRVFLGPLSDIKSNARCPLCRLVAFAVFSQDPQSAIRNFDVDDVDCHFDPWRTDAAEGTPFVLSEDHDKVGTSLVVHLESMTGPNLDLKYFHPLDIKILGGYNTTGLRSTMNTSLASRSLLNGSLVSSKQSSLPLARHWIDKCCIHHHLCNTPPRHRAVLDDLYVRTFQVVDTKRRTIVQKDPQSVEYAALSYVWGTGEARYPESDEESPVSACPVGSDVAAQPKNLACHSWLSGASFRRLPIRLPQTIEDAIYICTNIGPSYLWVDLFCINQTESEEKAIQLTNMGVTYRNAKYTIVAAYGAGSNAGLPGVRGYPSNALKGQRIEKVGGLMLITGLPTLDDQLSDSAWARRGWTFQEGILSSRCLVFGGYDISFHCRTGHLRESLQNAHLEGRQLMDEVENFPLPSRVSFSTDKKFGLYSKYVVGYTLRSFTHEKDILKAFAGLLGIFGQGAFFGVMEKQLVCSLTWCGLTKFRRPEIPSWSWAAWSGWKYYPFFEDSVLSSGDEAESFCPREVYLSGDDWPEIRIPNPVLQQSARVSISRLQPSLLHIESFVARFEVLAIDPEKPLFDIGDEVGEYRQSEFTPQFTIMDRYSNMLRNELPRPNETGESDDFQLWLPYYITTDDLNWLLDGPKTFVMLRKWTEIPREAECTSFNYVFALLIDDREEVGRRYGSMVIPVDFWDDAVVAPALKTLCLG